MKGPLVLIGDSLTFGYGVHKKDSWAYKLSEELSIQVINKGVNGDTTPSMLSRFYTDVMSFNPEYIFIMGGTNDLLSGRTVTSIVDNLELMIKDCGKNKVIIGIPPSIKPELAKVLFMPSSFYDHCYNSLPLLREGIFKLCNKYSLKYVDFYTVSLNNSDNIFTDGIHLTKLGNTLFLNELLSTLRF